MTIETAAAAIVLNSGDLVDTWLIPEALAAGLPAAELGFAFLVQVGVELSMPGDDSRPLAQRAEDLIASDKQTFLIRALTALRWSHAARLGNVLVH